MNAQAQSMFAPNAADMREHVDHIFGGFLDGHQDGRIELAWTDATPDTSGRYKLKHAETFGLEDEEIDRLIVKAIEVNSQPRVNVYIGACLRKPEAAPFGRCNDDDFYAATSVYADLDDKDANDQAKHRFIKGVPTLVVRTGDHPHWRNQIWWRLSETVGDPERHRAMINGLAAMLGGDGTISNPSRVMRLAGSIAWDQKPGRRPELTRIVRLKAGSPAAYVPEHIESIYPPLFSLQHARSARQAPGPDNGIVRAVGSLGLPTGKVIDGREKYMVALICARLIAYCGQYGAAPTADELFEFAWEAYEGSTDFTRPGRNRDEFADKCRSTIRRFDEGKIRGAETLERAVKSYQLQKDAKQEFRKSYDTNTEQPGSTEQPAGIKATPFKWVDPRTIPPREWIYDRHYIRRFVSTTVAPGGLGKSSLIIVEALAIASGRPLLGRLVDERVGVWYWNGEDPADELDRRIMATALRHKLKAEDFAGRLFVDTGRAVPIVIAERTRDGVAINAPLIEQVIKTITENAIGLMIVDPFIACHRVTENDNNEIERVAKAWAYIADVTGCAIELVHHVRKTGGNEVGVEDGRGAVALLSAARAARALNRMSAEEGAQAGVSSHRQYFRSDDGKANLAPPSERASWFQIVGFDLENATGTRPSDNVGVVEAWEWPDPLEGVTGLDMDMLIRRLGRNEYRADAQAAGWIGHVIIKELELGEGKPAANKAKLIQKIMLKNGALIEFEKENERRQVKTFVRVRDGV